MQAITLDNLLDSCADLPVLPEVATRVTRMASDPNVTAAAIGRVLSADQALSARVLHLANSAFFGVARRIGTLPEAVVVLGMAAVKNLTLAASIFPFFGPEIPGYALGRGELWRHAIACAVGAQALVPLMEPANAARVGRITGDEAFTAGLLHDLGKIVLSAHLRPYLGTIRERAVAESVSFVAAERAHLGFDHAQAGAALAERWNLPETLVDAIAFHPDPLAERAAPVGLACVTHLAEALCLTAGIGIGGDGLMIALQPEVLTVLGITAAPEELLATILDALALAEPAFDFQKAA